MFAVWRQPCDAFYQMTLRCFIPRQNVFTVENNFMTSCIPYVHLICHILWHYSAWVQLKNTYTIAVIAQGTKNHSIRCGGTIDIQLIMTLRMLTNRPILSVLDVYSRMSQLCTYSCESYNQSTFFRRNFKQKENYVSERERGERETGGFIEWYEISTYFGNTTVLMLEVDLPWIP